MPEASTDPRALRTGQDDLPAAFAALLTEARRQRATDLHVEPNEFGPSLRLRVDGALREIVVPANLPLDSILSLARSLCSIPSANGPQMGHGRITLAGRTLDLTAATFPTQHGDRLTLHLHSDSLESISLDQLRLAPAECIQLQNLTDMAQGVIISAGPQTPTKTALLYALLAHIDRSSRSVMTLEDPISASLPGVVQTAVQPAAGLTWNRALMHILRQDPDVIALSPPPQSRAFKNIFSAALEHRLFLLQLNTPSGAHTLRHLLDSGIAPFQLADSLQAVIAQRAIRVLCPECKMPGTPNLSSYSPEIAAFLTNLPHASFFSPVGCPRCRHTGYESVIPMLEILPMSASLADLLATNPTLGELRRATAIEGLPPLLHNALLKASIGLISLDEIRRVLPPGTL